MDKTLETLPLGRRPDGRTLITASWVVGHKDGGHRLLKNGEVVFENGEILFVGHDFESEVARRIDFGNALISPGLIDLDALSDLDTTILGIDHHPGWAKGRVWPRSYVEAGPYEMYTQEELAFQKRFAFGQLLLNGITTAAPIASLFYREWGETVAEFDAAADAAGELGLRVYLSPAYRSGGMVLEAPGHMVPVFDEERGFQGLRDAIAYIERQNGRHGDLVRGMLAPDRVETSTLGLIQRTDAAARDLGCKFRLHMAQGAMEVDTVRMLHGSTAPVWLARNGLLSDRLIAPHATNATDEDLGLYAENGVSIVHCPLVSGRGGSLLRSFSDCRRRGINIAMGTDTTPPDMLMNLLAGLITGRIADGAPDRLRAADLYDAATIGGARALGRRDLGHLSPGARADIAVFRLDDTFMAPSIDPITTIVTGGSGKITQAVFVDGRVSMVDRRLAAFDMQKARDQAQVQYDGLVDKYPQRSWNNPPVAKIFPPSYPIEGPTEGKANG
ncbi:amidohydrolase family protein [Brucella intermedia]|uniref:Amidohydrolase family protein n=1 Tax=Brucella intermedia TaxID=94625 RepID=A0A7V6TYW6_9HYPH|nr:amidohydrolase family protein [Brucella intermedia]PJR91687.1 N-ethylammeline chlorohydrolase [Ochrobactrum sp. 721/2009]PJT14749.1 N-ethylammeline chlorohydrolase [Ochrobactrum sp. 720/2009]PJT20420.1 N-ethylammeline chlorohydrolase [Ochrobactrum sp. 715/2009]PJT28390.1 N-ethylammeline chlorohydrolase [Ochrobactrum sp. 695/2009]PJT34852.1 N-ethylammeline chlorohydrolase [Ochrobactrum sp. 689/2009]